MLVLVDINFTCKNILTSLASYKTLNPTLFSPRIGMPGEFVAGVTDVYRRIEIFLCVPRIQWKNSG
jgi:hypothetical protein